MADETTQGRRKKIKSNFSECDLQEWEKIRDQVRTLLKKKHKDVKLSCVDKSVEV